PTVDLLAPICLYRGRAGSQVHHLADREDVQVLVAERCFHRSQCFRLNDRDDQLHGEFPWLNDRVHYNTTADQDFNRPWNLSRTARLTSSTLTSGSPVRPRSGAEARSRTSGSNSALIALAPPPVFAAHASAMRSS